MDIVILGFALATILAGAELFTNGIEWFGHKLQLAEGAVGSVLAAVGTALPETMIPLIAILASGTEAANEVGVGAILGAPFMLATLAMFVTGVAVLAARRRGRADDIMAIAPRVLSRDIGYFAIAYILAVGVAFVPADIDWVRWAVAVVLVGIYARYVLEHLRDESVSGDRLDLAPLRFHRLDRGAPFHPNPPRLRIVVGQVLVALGLIIVGAVAFVGAVDDLGRSLGVDEALLALVIAPIATELPEKFNSIIWIRQGKDTLALGNITGAMVFQAAIPTVVALVFAPEHWAVTSSSGLAFASAAIAVVSAATIFVPMTRRGVLRGRSLLVGGAFYAGYLGLVLVNLQPA